MCRTPELVNLRVHEVCDSEFLSHSKSMARHPKMEIEVMHLKVKLNDNDDDATTTMMMTSTMTTEHYFRLS